MPKGCAGVEPATTQRVSPRLLPLAFVYTTEFHPNRRERIRTSEAFCIASGLRLLWPLAYSPVINQSEGGIRTHVTKEGYPSQDAATDQFRTTLMTT